MSFNNLFWGDFDTPNHSQWRIKAESLLADRDVWHQTVGKHFPLGAITESRDGRKWRYCKNGAGVLAKAMINQGAVETAGWTMIAQTNTPDEPAVGDKEVTVVVTTTVTANAWIDGYLIVQDGTGEGEMYTIKDNATPTVNASTGFDVKVGIADTGGIRTAIPSASDFSAVLNKYSGTIVFPNNPTAPCTGVNNIAVTAYYYYWAQVHGPCPILTAASTDTIVIGDEVAAGAVTAGAMSLPDNANGSASGDTIIGYCMKAPAAASDYGLVDLTIE